MFQRNIIARYLRNKIAIVTQSLFLLSPFLKRCRFRDMFCFLYNKGISSLMFNKFKLRFAKNLHLTGSIFCKKLVLEHKRQPFNVV